MLKDLYEPSITPSELAAFSNEDIEQVLLAEQVTVASKPGKVQFQNWAKTFSCHPERSLCFFAISHSLALQSH